MDDNDKILIRHGVILDENCDEVCGFEGFFRKWRKLQTTTFLTIEIPNDKAEAVRNAVKALGGLVK